MTEILFFLLCFLGLFVGAVLIYLWLSKKQNPLQIKIEKAQTEKERDKLRIENEEYRQKEISWTEQFSSLKSREEQKTRDLENQEQLYKEKIQEKEESFEKELNHQKSYYEEKLQNQKNQFESQRESEKKLYEKKEEHFKQLADKTKIEFENTAKKIFLASTKSYEEESSKSLSQILKPFKEDIEGFKKSVQSFESKEKFLDQTINHFKDINLEMRGETKKLAQALKGDIKTQGQWGEFVLANILEKSGLRKNEEFLTNKQKMDIKDEQGSSLKPDVIVKLPDNKQIVIDSKVSLTNYQEYLSSDTEDQRGKCLMKILNSVSTHINNLASKKYSFAEGLRTPDFTLMFIPNEGIFSLVTQAKKDLFEKAWNQSIVLVSPTTLYATLRTVASIWKIERQNKNAKQIARESGLLYDKFVGFLNDMKNIDKGLDNAKKNYDQAIKKLDTGRGSLIGKIKRIKNLGANTSKDLPEAFRQEKDQITDEQPDELE